MTIWIFQGNPKRFKIDAYLRENQSIIWLVKYKKNIDDIQIGDIVYFWRSEAGEKGTGGVIARAIITAKPVDSLIPPVYWINNSDAFEVLPRVPMEVLELVLDGSHLNRETLKNNEILSDLLILKRGVGTNFKIKFEHAEELQRLWKKVTTTINIEYKEIPIPEPVDRKREYFDNTEENRNKVVYNYLFNGNSHRWLDFNILGLDSNLSKGYQSMGILHYLGLKNEFKGLFNGLTIPEAINLLDGESKLKPQYGHLYRQIILVILGIMEQGIISNTSEELFESANVEAGKEYPEGKIAYVLHRKRERNPQLIKDAKQLFISKNGHLFCEACNFDFQKTYGDIGIDFIEGHHKKLVSEMLEGETTKIEDIAMLCCNCHSMIHRKPLISVDELKSLITLH